METELDSTITTVLLVVAAVAAAGGVAFFAVGVYSELLAPFLGDVEAEAPGDAAGLGSLLVRRVGALNRTLVWPAYERNVSKLLVRGGQPLGFLPHDLLALQELGFVVGLVISLLATNVLGLSLWWVLLGVVLGASAPMVWATDQVTKRHLAITRALPFNLDLLTLSVEAGLDFAGAIDKVVAKGKGGPLRDELALVLRQMKMGKTREESLKSMVERVDLPALTQFVTALVQADRMGTSLGKILRVQANQLRVDRTQRAEKLAQQAPVKMLFPLIAFIFPTVFLILFGPIVFKFMFGHVAG